MKTVQFEAKFSDIEVVNPLFSKCKVYVMYYDLNRNNSDIDKDIVEKAIPSIFNVPIIGEFIEQKDDFGSHGGKIEISDQGVKFVRTTMPYGVVPESAIVSWENVTEQDGTEREYLVIDGAYLWTGRYEEASKIIEEGKGQSMEIEILSGKFNKDKIYQIDEFVFSALCVLGDSVEPCFESASIVAYDLNEDKFRKQFNQMIKELKFSLQNESSPDGVDINALQGGSQVDEIIKMLEKYSLTIEDLKAKEIDVEKFSLEELEEKVKEITSSNFALSQEQLEDGLKRELAEIEVIQDPYWEDWTYPRFSFVDYYVETKVVITADAKDGYQLVAFNYDVFGDNVEIDPESAQKYKITYEPMVISADPDNDDDAEVDIDEAVVPVAMADYKLEAKERELIQKFNSDIEAKEKAHEAAIAESEAKFTTLQEQFSSLETEVTELKEFKVDKLQTEREEKESALYEKFAAQLTEDEISPVKEKSADMNIEDIEKELFALVGKKAANEKIHNFNNKSNHIVMSIHEGGKDPINAPYGGVVEKYIKK